MFSLEILSNYQQVLSLVQKVKYPVPILLYSGRGLIEALHKRY